MTTRRSSVALAVLTAACWGIILLTPSALFWDDWITVRGDAVGLYNDLGLPWMGHVAVALSALGPIAFKIIGIVSAVVVALTARAIASRGLGLDSTHTWFVAALVALLPFNVARVSVAVLSTYSVSLAVFFVAWWVLVKTGSHRNVRVGAASALFFASFTTASLLPFIAVPVAHLALLEVDRSKTLWRELVRFAGRSWYLLLSPALFWLTRTAFLQPRGVYADYNGFAEWTWPPTGAGAGALIMLIIAAGGAAMLCVRALVQSHRRMVDLVTATVAGVGTVTVSATMWWLRGTTSVNALIITSVVAIAGLVMVATAISAARRPELAPRIGHSAFLASTGLVTFAIGALPYLVVDKIPQFNEWETRHQLLLPVGTALLALAAFVAATGPGSLRTRTVQITRALTVGVCAAAVVASGLMLVADWHKQAQVIAALRELDGVRDASTVVVTDDSGDVSFGRRQIRFYEPIGWLHDAYGDRTRFATMDTDAEAFSSGAFDSLLDEDFRYGFADWNPEGPRVGVHISMAPHATWWDLLMDRPVMNVTETATTVENDR